MSNLQNQAKTILNIIHLDRTQMEGLVDDGVGWAGWGLPASHARPPPAPASPNRIPHQILYMFFSVYKCFIKCGLALIVLFIPN